MTIHDLGYLLDGLARMLVYPLGAVAALYLGRSLLRELSGR